MRVRWAWPDRRVVGGTLLVSWLAALLLPAAWTGAAATSRVSGADVLLIGWLGVFIGQFGWFANPLLVGVVLPLATFVRRPWRRTAIVVATTLLLLTFDAALWDDIPGDDGPHPIIGHGAGYYLWFGVMLVSATWLLAVMHGKGKSG